MKTPEIEELKLQVEQKYGRVLNTSTDFDEFSLTMGQQMDRRLSASTLKRLWDYVNDSHRPRIFTLDLLSQYIGHKDFASFKQWLKTSTRYNSSFFNAEQLVSSELAPGSIIEIGWSPNRLVRLYYLGNSRYEVTHSDNSKMLPGDQFIAGCFIKEYPLYLPYLERDGEHTAPFVAGRNGGLTLINIIS